MENIIYSYWRNGRVMVMTFDYYYGAQAEQFNFIRIPKAMIVDPMFADLSVNAKLLCG